MWCTGDMMTAFHIALRNPPINSKNPAVKVRANSVTRTVWSITFRCSGRPSMSEIEYFRSLLYVKHSKRVVCLNTEHLKIKVGKKYLHDLLFPPTFWSAHSMHTLHGSVMIYDLTVILFILPILVLYRMYILTVIKSIKM